MLNQAFTETMLFTKGKSWNTGTCQQQNNLQMQLSIFNGSNWYLLNDRAVGN
jgi:hypothetical protein